MSEAGSAAQEVQEYMEEPTRRAPTLPMQAIPGRTGKVNYSLHDSVVRLPVSDKVKDAKKATIESKPDILGLRGPVWNESVALQPGKHHTHYSETLLSNTLAPELINSRDVRKLTGSTACKADRDAATLDRAKSPCQQLGGWNTSTVTPNSLEKQRQLEAATSASLTATRRKSPPAAYIDPVTRQAIMSYTIRSMKADRGADMHEMYDRYGPEGAEAMAAIQRMPVKETKPRIRTTRDDMDAVRALDDFEPGKEKHEEEGEAVPLGPVASS